MRNIYIVLIILSPFLVLVFIILHATRVTVENKEYRELLAKNGIEYYDENLYNQILAGNLDTVIMFIKAGTGINENFSVRYAGDNDDTGLTITMLAAKYNHLDMLKYFIEELYANVNKESYWSRGGLTALMVASEAGNTDIVKYLLSKGAHVDQRDKLEHLTALMYASKNGHYEIVKLLLEHNADVNARTKIKEYDEHDFGSTTNGLTAFMYAVDNNHKDIAELLLKYGANIDETNNWGESALLMLAKHYTSFDKKVESDNALMMKCLLDNGADINLIGEDSVTALMLLSEEYLDNTDILKYMLDNGAEINCKDAIKGRTALMYAATSNPENVQVLLDYGADISIKDNDGLTARDIAINEEQEEILEVFDKAMQAK